MEAVDIDGTEEIEPAFECSVLRTYTQQNIVKLHCFFVCRLVGQVRSNGQSIEGAAPLAEFQARLRSTSRNAVLQRSRRLTCARQPLLDQKRAYPHGFEFPST